jgi:hypothetical protein
VRPSFSYEGSPIECDFGTISGTTGSDSDVTDFDLAFADDCRVNGLAATVSCTGTFRWHVLSPSAGEITRFNPGFSCTVGVPGVCVIRAGEQDLPIPGGLNRGDPIDGAIDIEVDAHATRTGSSLCGPLSGVATWRGKYALDPMLMFG